MSDMGKKLEGILRELGVIEAVTKFLSLYEEFALRPEFTLRLICQWLHLDYTQQMLSPGLYSKSHILLGNRVRQQGDRNQQIAYDASWLRSGGVGFSTFLFSLPFVTQMHRDLVYSNDVL